MRSMVVPGCSIPNGWDEIESNIILVENVPSVALSVYDFIILALPTFATTV